MAARSSKYFPIGKYLSNYTAIPFMMPHASRKKIPDRERIPIGAFVKERRQASGMTQPELAALAGVGLRFIVELERGKPTMRMDTVNAVLRVFGKQLGVVDALRPAESKEQ